MLRVERAIFWEGVSVLVPSSFVNRAVPQSPNRGCGPPFFEPIKRSRERSTFQNRSAFVEPVGFRRETTADVGATAPTSTLSGATLTVVTNGGRAGHGSVTAERTLRACILRRAHVPCHRPHGGDANGRVVRLLGFVQGTTLGGHGTAGLTRVWLLFVLGLRPILVEFRLSSGRE